MDPVTYIDRLTGKCEQEKIYKESALRFIYGEDWVSSFFGTALLHTLVKNPLFSRLYGYWQNSSFSRKKIKPFIKTFNVDPSEFLESVDAFTSFNDFFIRKLKPAARPIDTRKKTAIIPADGRYQFIPHIERAEGFYVKGEKFNLASLLEDQKLASQYAQGSMVIARLCPTDYHRFHFPCDCVPQETRWINGWLYSVNPIALKRDISIFTKNKRTLSHLDTVDFGKVLFMEVGATSVGSITQTYLPGRFYAKGAEKGYFGFGASALIIFFEPGRIQFDADLLRLSQKGFTEIRCLMGQSMGTAS